MKKIKKIISNVLTILVDCIIPTLPIMIGVGMMKVILILVGPTVLNILHESSPTYLVLSFVADAGYYFMPIYVAFSSASVFQTNKFVAALIGGMLISPAYVELVKLNNPLDFLGLPIVLTDYGNQVLPSIIAIWIMSYIYNYLNEHIPNNFKSLLVPLITIIVMIPITFSAIGPFGVYLGAKLVDLILLLKDIGPLGNAILCAIIPFITILGLGGANLSAMLLLSSSGCDPILFFSNVLYNNVLGFVTLAIYLKDKKSETLAASITSAISGTSEPALFGIVVNDAKAMMALVIGDFVGGLYAGIAGVKSYAMASFGIFGIITTIGPNSSIVHAFIAMILACLVGFIISFITHKKIKHE